MKRFSKILFFAAAVFIFASGSFFADEASDFYANLEGKGSVVLIYSSELLNGMKDGSDAWVAKSIKENVIHDLTVYGKMKCVDLEELKNIKDVQKKSEGVMFDSSNPIEMGKLVNAKKYITITTTRVGLSYNMVLRVVDAETGIAQSYSTKKTYDSPEAYVNQAHYENIGRVLGSFDIVVTSDTNNQIKVDIREAERNTRDALASKAAHADELEKMRLENERIQLENQQREQQAREEKARQEREAAQRAEAAAREKERQKAAKLAANPFVGNTFTCDIQNGSRQDSYKLQFTDETSVVVIVTSLGSSGKQTFTAEGRYYYRDEVLSVTANMSSSPIRHIKNISWKAVPTFSKGYSSFSMIIPSSSLEGAKTVKADFYK